VRVRVRVRERERERECVCVRERERERSKGVGIKEDWRGRGPKRNANLEALLFSPSLCHSSSRGLLVQRVALLSRRIWHARYLPHWHTHTPPARVHAFGREAELLLIQLGIYSSCWAALLQLCYVCGCRFSAELQHRLMSFCPSGDSDLSMF
jgi:hypothetical protein